LFKTTSDNLQIIGRWVNFLTKIQKAHHSWFRPFWVLVGADLFTIFFSRQMHRKKYWYTTKNHISHTF